MNQNDSQPEQGTAEVPLTSQASTTEKYSCPSITNIPVRTGLKAGGGKGMLREMRGT